MKREEMRIAIAGLCGKTCQHCKGTGFLPKFSETEYAQLSEMRRRDCGEGYPKIQPRSPCSTICELPNYPEDLNAMREMEKTLSPQESELYACELLEVLQIPHALRHHARTYFLIANATSEQRCIAFLKIKGKWVE